jgi:hypothetical protein
MTYALTAVSVQAGGSNGAAALEFLKRLTDRMVMLGMEVKMAADTMAIPIAPARQTRTTR